MPYIIYKERKMAKTPRLSFYGVTLSLVEVRRLALGAGYAGSPAGSRGISRHNGDIWLPYDGRYLMYHGTPEKFQAEDLPQFYEQGLIRYDKKRHCAVWTELGARYLMRVARNNDHVRFGHTRKYVVKEERLERKRIREMKPGDVAKF